MGICGYQNRARQWATLVHRQQTKLVHVDSEYSLRSSGEDTDSPKEYDDDELYQYEERTDTAEDGTVYYAGTAVAGFQVRRGVFFRNRGRSVRRRVESRLRQGR